MSAGAADFEALLREALTPVDPPADLAQRLELTLVNLTELAHEELEAWELKAMRDPRNWARPAAAVVVGATAGTALVALRVGHHECHSRRSVDGLGAGPVAQRPVCRRRNGLPVGGVEHDTRQCPVPLVRRALPARQDEPRLRAGAHREDVDAQPGGQRLSHYGRRPRLRRMPPNHVAR